MKKKYGGEAVPSLVPANAIAAAGGSVKGAAPVLGLQGIVWRA